jgi:3-oxoacyl-[acyl-carrier protein] reductase
MNDATRKIALVTGASRGIGAAIASALADHGCHVVGTATSESGANMISEKLMDRGGEGRVLNVTDPDSIARLMESVRSEMGDPLILINNAGITQDNILMRMKDDEWNNVIDTNLNALFRLTKACVRGMTKARWGRVVTLPRLWAPWGILVRATTPQRKREQRVWRGHWRRNWGHDQSRSIVSLPGLSIQI